ncbi:MAG: hypothetical protein KA712_03220 [Myxococcales bacterium]|nr:hypothetical protein [Myxococcales bacterium]
MAAALLALEGGTLSSARAAEPLMVSDFVGTQPAVNTPWSKTTQLAEGVSNTGWTRSPQVPAALGHDNLFAFLINANATPTTLAEAVSLGHYVSVTVAPAASGWLDLSGAPVSFGVDRLEWNAPVSYAVFTSHTGFSADAAVFVSPTMKKSEGAPRSFAFQLPATAAWNALTEPLEIRIYAFGSQYRNKPTSLTSFSLGGRLGQTPKTRLQVGMNLSGVVDYSTDLPFVDKFKHARAWSTRNSDGTGAWDTKLGGALPIDANGWPLAVPFTPPGAAKSQMVHTTFRLPESGTYVLFFEGSGRFRVRGAGFNHLVNASGPGSRTLEAVASNVDYGNPIQTYLEIYETSASNPLRNLRVLHSRHLGASSVPVFEPLFVERLRGFSPVRFMDWAETNGSDLVHWQDRPGTEWYTQTDHGVALEYMIALCNELQSDCWFNVPHLASDDFVLEMAAMIRDELAPGLLAYVEYSNETWNTQFAQGKHVAAAGAALYPWLTPTDALQRFAVRQQVRVWELFADVFGAAFETRVRLPLGGQAANNYVNDRRLAELADAEINPRGLRAQGLSIAPYFGKFYRGTDLGAGAPGVDQILEDARTHLEGTVVNRLVQLQSLGKAYGVQIWAIEAGQSVKGVDASVQNDATFVANMIAANRDQRMGDLYDRYLTLLDQYGVSMAMQFSFVAAPGKYGAWGGLEFLDQDFAPKHQSLLDWRAGE